MLLRRLSTALGLAFVLVLGLASAALAADLELGPGARAMGMAGAFVAVADDGTAAYWNPAGITQLKILGITPSIGAGGDWMKLQTSIGEGYPPNLGNTELKINGMVGALFRGFGASFLFTAGAKTTYVDKPDPETDESTVDVKAMGTGFVTLAHRFGDNFALGANLKVLYGQRVSYPVEGDPTSYIEGSGTGYGLDVGALFKVGEFFRVGAKVEDLYTSIGWDETRCTYNPVSSAWEKNSAGRKTETIPALLRLGLAVKPPLFGTLIAAQIDSPLGGGGGETTYRIGLEQGVLIFKLRLGAILDSGFSLENYTLGLGLKLGPVVFDLAGLMKSGLSPEAAVLTAGFTF